MTFETQQTYLGKTQAIHLSEIQSEKLIFFVRLGVGAAYVLFLSSGMLFNNLSLHTFIIGIVATLVFCLVSGFGLFRLGWKPHVGASVYGHVFVDVTYITTVIWSHTANEFSLIHNSLFCAYFIVLTFTALHYRSGLVFFCGSLSAIEYSAFYFWYITTSSNVPPDSLDRYIIQMGILLLVSIISILISRNNFESIQRVVTSEVRYQNLVHRLPEMLFTLDSNRRFIWANMASYSLLAIPSKAIKRRSIEDFFINPPFKLDRSGLRGTFEIRDYENNHKFVDCLIQPVEEKDGIVYEGIMSDVTDRELAITQREEMVNRLFQYQKMESLGTLASGMAHDFNNILQTITDVTTVVKKDTEEERTRDRMDMLSETLVDARFLVSELLAFGKKATLKYVTIDLQKYLPDICQQFGTQLGAQYSIDLRVPDAPLLIKGDPSYLKRIFQNFFVNARDAMPHGGTITLECFAHRNEGEIGNIILKFSDTGPGIPAEIVDKIFDPFFTTKKPGKGTGLGLALVQRIVSMHNGSIDIEHTGKSGTTFRITLPEIDLTEVDNDTKWIQANRINARLLLMDDDAKIRNILRFFLTEFGYQICEAESLETGVAELTKYASECKIVVMDWKLGNDNPHKVVNSLRKVNPELLVIVVSGYPPNQKSISSLGIHKWFTKPYDKNQLDVEIQRALYLFENRKKMS